MPPDIANANPHATCHRVGVAVGPSLNVSARVTAVPMTVPQNDRKILRNRLPHGHPRIESTLTST